MLTCFFHFSPFISSFRLYEYCTSNITSMFSFAFWWLLALAGEQCEFYCFSVLHFLFSLPVLGVSPASPRAVSRLVHVTSSTKIFLSRALASSSIFFFLLAVTHPLPPPRSQHDDALRPPTPTSVQKVVSRRCGVCAPRPAGVFNILFSLWAARSAQIYFVDPPHLFFFLTVRGRGRRKCKEEGGRERVCR